MPKFVWDKQIFDFATVMLSGLLYDIFVLKKIHLKFSYILSGPLLLKSSKSFTVISLVLFDAKKFNNAFYILDLNTIKENKSVVLSRDGK